jgi:hypothetical protein
MGATDERNRRAGRAGKLHRALALDPELDGVDLRVFLFLFSRLNFRRAVCVPQIEVAQALGRHQEHISRSIRKLREKGILIPGEKVRRSTAWRLNPDYGQ